MNSPTFATMSSPRDNTPSKVDHPLSQQSSYGDEVGICTSLNFDNISQQHAQAKLSVSRSSSKKESLKILLGGGCWSEGLTLISEIQAQTKQKEKEREANEDDIDTIQLVLCQVVCLSKLGKYQEALNVCLTIDDFDAEFIEGKEGEGKKIPFSLRLMKAQMECLINSSSRNSDALYLLLRRCHEKVYKTQDEETQNEWKNRETSVLITLLTRLLSSSDYEAFFSLIENTQRTLSSKEELDLINAIGKAHLQYGNVSCASKSFLLLEQKLGESNVNENEPENLPSIHMNRGVIALSKNEFPLAIDCFKRCLELDHFYVPAVNALAISYLFMNNLEKAISTLENSVKEDPNAFISEVSIQNLLSLRDLATENPAKAKELISLVKQFAEENFSFGNRK